jgi:hypothetical protein
VWNILDVVRPLGSLEWPRKDSPVVDSSLVRVLPPFFGVIACMGSPY